MWHFTCIQERNEAEKLFSSLEAEEAAKRESVKTFTPGEIPDDHEIQKEKQPSKPTAPTKEQIIAIKVSYLCISEAFLYSFHGNHMHVFNLCNNFLSWWTPNFIFFAFLLSVGCYCEFNNTWGSCKAWAGTPPSNIRMLLDKLLLLWKH